MSVLIPKGGNDLIQTPLILAEKLIGAIEGEMFTDDNIWDPCCGEGVFGYILRKHGFKNVIESDIREVTQWDDRPTVFRYDFLSGSGDWIEGEGIVPNGIQTWDCIISNPPWSKIRAFTQQCYAMGVRNIYWLTTINHFLALKARLRDMRLAKYGIRRIFTVETPESWPSSGFQLGFVHIQRKWNMEKHGIGIIDLEKR